MADTKLPDGIDYSGVVRRGEFLHIPFDHPPTSDDVGGVASYLANFLGYPAPLVHVDGIHYLGVTQPFKDNQPGSKHLFTSAINEYELAVFTEDEGDKVMVQRSMRARHLTFDTLERVITTPL